MQITYLTTDSFCQLPLFSARGDDLNARIDGDSLPEFEAVKILKQVLEGLKFMHDKVYMHLDLKVRKTLAAYSARERGTKCSHF